MGKHWTYTLAFSGLMMLVANGAARILRGKDDLQGEVVLVTGGSRGLGLALAREFGRCGCRVAICARDEVELEQAREQLQQQGVAEIFTVACDVAQREQVERMLEAVTRQYGRIDILVNNAAIIQVGAFAAQTRRDFEDALNITFWGMVDCIYGVLPQMRERGTGRIVNITSIGGKVSVPHLMPYCTAKFAAVAFSSGLHAELASSGIHITTIVPGLMRTGSFFKGLFKGDHQREFMWFSLGDSLPLLSMNADKAARQIVDATRRKEAERILTLPANILARFYGLFPGLTTNLIRVVDRLVLPDTTDARKGEASGITLYNRTENQPLKALLTLSRTAAHRLNQFANVEQPIPD